MYTCSKEYMDFGEQTPLLGRNSPCTRRSLIASFQFFLAIALLVPDVVGVVLTINAASLPCFLANATADALVSWLYYVSWINLSVSVVMYTLVASLAVSSVAGIASDRSVMAILQIYTLFVISIVLSGLVQMNITKFHCGIVTYPLIGLYVVSSLVTVAPFLQWCIILLVLDITPRLLLITF